MWRATNRALSGLVFGAAALAGCAGESLVLPEEGTPARLTVVSGDGQEGRPGEWLGQPLVVEVRSGDGVLLPGVRVAFEFASSDATGAVDPGSVRTGSDGRAAAEVRLGTSTGTQLVVATVEEPTPSAALRASFAVRAVEPPAGGDDDDGGNDDGGGSDDGDGGNDDDDGGNDDDDGGNDDDNTATRPGSLNIPRGHLPSAGRCRIWYPSRSPGQQPGETGCAAAIAAAPAGTWVLERRSAAPGEIRLHLIHSARRGVVVGRYIYSAETGAYLREG